MVTKTMWTPSKAMMEQSNLHHYLQWLKSNHEVAFKDYDQAWLWSTQHPDAFWKSIWEYFDIIHSGHYTNVMEGPIMPGTKWFKGTHLNYAEHLFRFKNPSRPAFIFKSETHPAIPYSWDKLERQVLALQQWLIQKGVTKGDRVVGYLPNIPEAIVAFIAVNSIGAIWSCCSPDFGEKTVIERFQQIHPKVIIGINGYQYSGKKFDRTLSFEKILAALPTIEQTVLVKYPGLDAEPSASLTHWTSIQEETHPATQLKFKSVPFEHPIWVLYSSGTTGLPKAITHSHGGVLLEHLKYLSLQNDVKPGEHFFWFTTTGWMMWNFLQASMLVGAIPVLYDGSPVYPSLKALWKMTEELPIQHFGTSAPFLTACMKRNLSLKDQFNFTALRSIGSTGSPLPPEVFDWVYQSIKSDLWLCSMSGGTDVCTAFVGSSPLDRVLKGRIQKRALGCALYAYDETGNPIENQLGEMVIEQPMPSMPIYFWNDPNDQRYLSSYFSEYPGKWRHGDWIQIFEDGSLVIHGRSDATLNRKGVRIGTAEIYNALDELEEIKDALIINLERKDGSDFMPLFVELIPPNSLTPSLTKQIKDTLKINCSPRHVPDVVVEVPQIPYTLSGKKMEVPVKKILMGLEATKSLNRDAIRNPDAITFFEAYAQSLKEK